MVLTLEPNLRIPSFNGLQHLDSLVITEHGYERLARRLGAAVATC